MRRNEPYAIIDNNKTTIQQIIISFSIFIFFSFVVFAVAADAFHSNDAEWESFVCEYPNDPEFRQRSSHPEQVDERKSITVDELCAQFLLKMENKIFLFRCFNLKKRKKSRFGRYLLRERGNYFQISFDDHNVLVCISIWYLIG